MNFQKIRLVAWSGFLSTLVLLVVMGLENMTEMFQMDPVFFMIDLAEHSILLWMLVYFVLGWLWSAAYLFFFNRFLAFEKIPWLRGAIYGILVGMITYIGISMTGDGMGLGSINTQIIGTLLAYTAFGIVLGTIVGMYEKKRR